MIKRGVTQTPEDTASQSALLATAQATAASESAADAIEAAETAQALISNPASVVIAASFDFTAIPETGYNDKIWEIRNQHNLAGANIALPEGVILYFNGGALLNAGNLQGDNTVIVNPHNLQIFDLSITFTGTWTGTRATPQWFGAVCSASPNVLVADGAVSSSAAIQKLFDSPFQPVFPPGYYYITAPTVITRQVYADFGTPVMEMIDEMGSFVYRNDHVRFYTDQNVKFWEYRKHNIFLIGGVMDVRNCDTYDESIYYAHADYRIQRGEASGYAIGSLANVRREGATGTYFRWSVEGATVNYGYITGFTIKTKTNYIPRGIIIDDPSTSGVTGTWANGFVIDAFIDGAKLYGDIRAGGTQIEIVGQTREVLTEVEKDTWGIYLKTSNAVSAFVWDTSSTNYDGFYRTNASHAIYNATKGIRMFNWSYAAKSGNQVKGFPMEGPASISPGVDVQLLRNTSETKTFISELHNALPVMAKSGSYSINAFDGSTVDFDTDFDDGGTLGLSAASDITITNSQSLAGFRKTGTYYSVGAGANLNTDFVEVIFTHPSGVYGRDIFVNLIQNSTAVKRIQVITVDTSDNVVMEEYNNEAHASYSVRYYQFRSGQIKWYKKVMVRLIGHTAAAGPVYIGDVAMVGSAATTQNYVNRFEIPYAALHLLLNQSGTNAPVVDVKLNSMSDNSPSSAYLDIGDYTLTYANQFPAAKIMPLTLTIYKATGSIVFTRISDSVISVKTYDLNGIPSNGILVDQPYIVNRYW